jgi:photosystem II stability/assembly factor-like uncharacterized protein
MSPRNSGPFLLASVALALTLGNSARAATAAVAPWTPFGPGGGTVQALAVDPHDPAVVYAVGSADFYNLSGSLCRSTDGGATWKALVPAEFVVIDPRRPATIYAGGSNLLRSTDAGSSWIDITPRLAAGETPFFTTLAVAPGGVLLAADQGRLLRSTDGGGTWSVAAEGTPTLRAILVDPVDPRRAYFLSDDALFKSDDGGAHWTLAGQPENSGTGFYGAGFALAPSTPKTLYVLEAGDDRVFRSDDGAATWRRVGSAPSMNFPLRLLVDPRSPDRLYVAGGAGVSASEDGGRSWRRTTTGLPRGSDGQPLAVFSLAQAPSRPDTLFAGTQSWGVAQSQNAGARWRTGLATGFDNAQIVGLQFHPLRPGMVYLFQSDGRSFRSTDHGRSWQPFARALAQTGLSGLAFDPADPDLLYGTDQAGTWKSGDGGKTWTRLSDPQGRLAVVDGKTLIALACGLKRSRDGGRTWTEKIPCDVPDGDGSYRVGRSLWVDPRSPRTAYAHLYVTSDTHPLGQEAYRTRDGGATWAELALSSPSYFAVAPSDPQVLYAIDSGVLLRSGDGGESWNVVNPSLPSSVVDQFYGIMVVDATDPDTLYIAANPLLISHDGGATFQSIDSPFEAGKRGADRLWTDRGHPGKIYASAVDGGLYVGQFE